MKEPKNMKCIVQNEEACSIWMGCTSDLMIVDHKNFFIRQIKNFLPKMPDENGNPKEPRPLYSISKDSAKTICVLFEMESLQCLAYSHPGVREPSCYLLRELSSNSRLVFTQWPRSNAWLLLIGI